MRTFTTFLFALSLGCFITGCDSESANEPAAESVRAKQKIPCGGFAGLSCPDGLTCVDDPADSCDPDQGGADCIGMCVKPHGKKHHDTCDYNDPARAYVAESVEECAVIKFVCAEGSHYFADGCGCGCELD